MKGEAVTGHILDIINIFLALSIITVLFLITGLEFSNVTDIISNILGLMVAWFLNLDGISNIINFVLGFIL